VTIESETSEMWAAINTLREDKGSILIALGRIETLLCERCEARGKEQKRQDVEILALNRRVENLAKTNATQQQTLTSVVSDVRDISADIKTVAAAHVVALNKETERSTKEVKSLDLRITKLEQDRKAFLGWSAGAVCIGSFLAAMVGSLFSWWDKLRTLGGG
jgi:multidrug resistance efflux pump